ncbi:MAG: T9SS type A sorting domain-containing protein [Janthinobacterium lividum]
MKKSLFTHLPLALLLALGTTQTTFADHGPTHHFGEHGPGRSEIQAYIKANVLPVARQQRQKLETELAPADRDQLATYRAQLKEVRTQEQALHQQLHAAGAPSQSRPAPIDPRSDLAESHRKVDDAHAPRFAPTLTDAQHQQLHDLRRQTHSILLSVEQMALKYDANIERLFKEVEPQQTKWLTDIRAIIQKDAPADQRQLPAPRPEMPHQRPNMPGFGPDMAEGYHGPDGPGHHGPDGPGHYGRLFGPMGHYFRPVAFLLMPSEATEVPVTFGGTSLYPNPATAATQLQYDVKKAGPVTVDLLDASGTKLRTLLQQTQKATGTYSEPLDFGDLPQGTYYYKITTNSGTETKRFVKE